MYNNSVDEIVLQYSTRGMDKLYKTFPSSYLSTAAEVFLTLPKGKVFLYTGFYLGGHAETDGPLGTYFLYKALVTLGYEPIIITDSFCTDFFLECETLYLSHENCTETHFLNLLSQHNPICHISIERCAKNINGIYRTSAGQDISEFTPCLDQLFELGNKSAPTFAIADGGNEIGMGNFQDFLKNELNVIPSTVKCDFAIIASVSNWGAYGFITELEKKLGISLLPVYEKVDTYMDYIVSLGSVDGMSLKNEKTVDGKNWDTERKILEDLKMYIDSNT